MITVEERISRLEAWAFNIYNTNQFLSQEINRLWTVDPSEVEGQVFRVRDRIVNFTRAVKEAYESREIPGTFPQFRLIDNTDDGPRYYYFFKEAELKRISTPPRRLHLLRGEDFTKAEVIPPQEWIIDDHMRDRVVRNLTGLVPYGILNIK